MSEYGIPLASYIKMEMDNETLVKLAKERAKELKVAQRKLAKVEERYIQKHNELSEI
jgi:hypothetical protein